MNTLEGLTENQLNAYAFLQATGIFHDPEDADDDLTDINLNDTFGWALAYSVEVTADELEPLQALYRRYGFCGVLYFAAVKDGWDVGSISFQDTRRMIEFVQHEEGVRTSCSSSSEYAYKKAPVTLGAIEVAE